MKKTIYILATSLVLLYGCQQPIKPEFIKDGKTYIIDTLLITDTSNALKPVKASAIVLDKNLEKFANSYSKLLESKAMLNSLIAIDFSSPSSLDSTGIVEIPKEYIQCMSTAPKTIKDLRDGVVVDAYEFKKGDEGKLGFLGFLNVDISDDEKITVVEFSQFGSQICVNKQLKYGVGCRLMMRIKEYKRSAKLNTPQQITASVIFGKAEVTFSMRTFGITGPGVSRLNKVGTVNEDTYKSFMEEVSNLIVDVYNKDSQYDVNPQPLFLKQN